MVWPTAEELRLDEVAPQVGGYLCDSLTVNTASLATHGDPLASLDDFMEIVDIDGAQALCVTLARVRGRQQG